MACSPTVVCSSSSIHFYEVTKDVSMFHYIHAPQARVRALGLWLEAFLLLGILSVLTLLVSLASWIMDVLLQMLRRKKCKDGQIPLWLPFHHEGKSFPKLCSTNKASHVPLDGQKHVTGLLASKETGHRCLEFLVSTRVRQERGKGWEGWLISQPLTCHTTLCTFALCFCL